MSGLSFESKGEAVRSPEKLIKIVIVDDIKAVLLAQKRFMRGLLPKNKVQVDCVHVKAMNSDKDKEQFWEDNLSLFRQADLIILDGDMPIKGHEFTQELINRGVALDKIYARAGASYFGDEIRLEIKNQEKEAFLPKICFKKGGNVKEDLNKQFFHHSDLFLGDWVKLYAKEKDFKIK